MNTVESSFVWTHENAGQVRWLSDPDIDGEGAWLSGDLMLGTGTEKDGTYWWAVTLFRGHYPFVYDVELAGDTSYIDRSEARWRAIRWACRWLVRETADCWLEALAEAEMEKRYEAEQQYFDSTSEAEQRFDVLESRGNNNQKGTTP